MSFCTYRCPKCQLPRLVTWPLGPSVQASRPSFTAPGLSARHLDLHLAVDHRIRAPHLHNTSQKTCRTHSFRHGRVSHHSTYFVDHIDNHSSQNEHTRVLVNLVFANTFLYPFGCHVSRAARYSGGQGEYELTARTKVRQKWCRISTPRP